MELSNQKNLIELCPDETITRLDGENYSLVKNNDTKYEYNTKYKSRLDKYDGSFCINISEPIDCQKIYKVFSIDKSRIPDAYDIKVFMVVPCKWHKKKRINKKLIKKYGHPNYVQQRSIRKGICFTTYPDGTFEFIKKDI